MAAVCLDELGSKPATTMRTGLLHAPGICGDSTLFLFSISRKLLRCPAVQLPGRRLGWCGSVCLLP